MPERTAKANAARSRVRARVEHVFAQPKDRMGLFIRTIGLKRAEAKITLASLACNMNRLIFHERPAAMGSVRPEIKTTLTKKHNDAANLRPFTPNPAQDLHNHSNHVVDGGVQVVRYDAGRRRTPALTDQRRKQRIKALSALLRCNQPIRRCREISCQNRILKSVRIDCRV